MFFMTTQRQRDEMRDFLVAKLSHNGNVVEPIRREIIPGSRINSGYIKVNNCGLVVLVDETYTGKQFEIAYQKALRQFPNNSAFVFLKDGKTYFRSAAAKNYYKKEHGFSLKHLTEEQMRNLILLSPAEKIIFESGGSMIQYYQPQSAKLEEGLESFRFTPAPFDRSHIPSSRRYGPEQEDSKRLAIWEERWHFTGNLSLVRHLLKSGQQ